MAEPILPNRDQEQPEPIIPEDKPIPSTSTQGPSISDQEQRDQESTSKDGRKANRTEKAREALRAARAANSRPSSKNGPSDSEPERARWRGITVEPVLSGLAESVGSPLNEGEKKSVVWIDRTIEKHGGEKFLEIGAGLVLLAIIVPRALAIWTRNRKGKNAERPLGPGITDTQQ